MYFMEGGYKPTTVPVTLDREVYPLHLYCKRINRCIYFWNWEAVVVDRDRMVVGFTTTGAISGYLH